jgi:hypothetical protein
MQSARSAAGIGVILAFGIMFVVLGFTGRLGLMLAALLAPTTVQPEG